MHNILYSLLFPFTMEKNDKTYIQKCFHTKALLWIHEYSKILTNRYRFLWLCILIQV